MLCNCNSFQVYGVNSGSSHNNIYVYRNFFSNNFINLYCTDPYPSTI